MAEALNATGFMLNSLFSGGGGAGGSADLREKKIKLIIKPNPNTTALLLLPPALILHSVLSPSQFPSQANNIYSMRP